MSFAERKGTDVLVQKLATSRRYEVSIVAPTGYDTIMVKKKVSVSLLLPMISTNKLKEELGMEWRVLNMMKSSPFIINAYGYDEKNGAIYLEHHLGLPSSYLRRRSQQVATDEIWGHSGVDYSTPGYCAFVVHDLVAALKDLHAAGYVHLDIKPENYMFNGYTGKLIDLGSCQCLTGPYRSPVSTYPYMPPEYVFRDQYNEWRSSAYDMWAVGMVVASLLLGSHPLGHSKAFNIDTLREMMHVKTDIAVTRLTHQHSIMAQLAVRLLSWKPSERPSAAECLELIQEQLTVSIERYHLTKTPVPEQLRRFYDQYVSVGTDASEARPTPSEDSTQVTNMVQTVPKGKRLGKIVKREVTSRFLGKLNALLKKKDARTILFGDDTPMCIVCGEPLKLTVRGLACNKEGEHTVVNDEAVTKDDPEFQPRLSCARLIRRGVRGKLNKEKKIWIQAWAIELIENLE